MSIIPVFPCDLSRSSRVLNVYLQLRICVRRVSRYIRESPKLLRDTVYTATVLFSIVCKQWSLENAFEEKEKKTGIKRSIVIKLSFIDIFVVLTVDATVNYQFMTNSSSISFRN